MIDQAKNNWNSIKSKWNLLQFKAIEYLFKKLVKTVEDKPHQLTAWNKKKARFICDRSVGGACVLCLWTEGIRMPFQPFPFVIAECICSTQIVQLFRQNKPYCFHVIYTINWLLLPLTRITTAILQCKNRHKLHNWIRNLYEYITVIINRA